MQITNSPFKHCDLVKVEGRLDSSTAPQLAEAMEAVTNAGRFKIVIDLADVSFMSSAGLRVLINTQKTCKRYNRGELVLAAIPANIHSALDLAGFIPLYKVFDDALAAVGSF
jgi:anti-sigma B factor antagonist